MHYILLLLILLFFPTSCRKPEVFEEVDFENVPYTSNVDTEDLIYAINVYAVTMNEPLKHKIELEDSIIYYNDQYIEKIWLKFITQDLETIWDARKTIVYIVDGLIDRINNDMILRNYAKNRQLTPLNVDVTIIYESFLGRFVDDRYVNALYLQDGLVYYYAFDVFDPKRDYWHQRVEPYWKTQLLEDAKTTASLPYWNKKEGAKEKSALFKILKSQQAPPPPPNATSSQSLLQPRLPLLPPPAK